MILSFFIQAFYYFLLLSKCNGTTITKAEEKEIEENFNSFFMEGNVEALFWNKPHLRVSIIEKAIKDKFKDNLSSLRNGSADYTIPGLIMGNFFGSFSPYLNPAHKFDLNYYVDPSFNYSQRPTTSLYEGKEIEIILGFFTPLQFAVAKNRIEIVRQMVDASLSPKLKLDMPLKTMCYVNARSIARKLYDPAQRIAMLEVLKIDPEKHDLTTVKRHLKDDLEITVKEAVIADDIDMVESALFLGNFGDKTDVSIVRWAMKNNNFMIIEMLVMEGYAIPEENDRPNCNELKTFVDVDFLLSQKNNRNRRPIAHRERKIFTVTFPFISSIPYSPSCF